MTTSNSSENPKERGMVSAIAMLVGALLALFSLFSVLNTATGWNIEVSNTPLPNDWESTLGLIGVTVIFWAIWAIMNFVGPVRRFGQQRPWIMALIVVVALVGAIVGITIWDNANIKARENSPENKAWLDSIHKADSANGFDID